MRPPQTLWSVSEEQVVEDFISSEEWASSIGNAAVLIEEERLLSASCIHLGFCIVSTTLGPWIRETANLGLGG